MLGYIAPAHASRVWTFDQSALFGFPFPLSLLGGALDDPVAGGAFTPGTILSLMSSLESSISCSGSA